MMHSLRLALVALLFLLGGCAHLAQGDRPVVIEPLFAALPASSEVSALVELGHADGGGKYLLAINTTQDAGLSVLSPQGMPAFHVGERAGGLQVTSQTGLPAFITPAEFLSYLLMAYGDESVLRDKALMPHYTMLAQTQRREYKNQLDGLSRVLIEYQGQGPWYDSVTIADTNTGLDILITTLKTRHVQPR